VILNHSYENEESQHIGDKAHPYFNSASMLDASCCDVCCVVHMVLDGLDVEQRLAFATKSSERRSDRNAEDSSVSTERRNHLANYHVN
jgi:hypothetical protein